MNTFFLHIPIENHEGQPDKHIVVNLREEYATSEGSEFLDDAIRMKDQPLVYREERLQSEAQKTHSSGSEEIQNK